MIKYDKKTKDGNVAVIISRGFGAGWSTWNYEDDLNEAMKFDSRLVDLIENGESEKITEDFLQNLWGVDYSICTLGSNGLDVVWLPFGTQFYIDEYDGAESIVTSDHFSSTA